MTKTEIKAVLKEKFGYSSWEGKNNFRPSKEKGYFGELVIGSSSPMDVTSAGAERRAEKRNVVLQVLHDMGLMDLVEVSETDRWTYAGKKGCECYDRGWELSHMVFVGMRNSWSQTH